MQSPTKRITSALLAQENREKNPCVRAFGKEFWLPSAILQRSPFFKAMLREDAHWKEVHNLIELHPEVDCLIDFDHFRFSLYSMVSSATELFLELSSRKFERVNLLSLYACGSYLQLQDVMDLCTEEICKRKLTVDSALWLMNFAEKYSICHKVRCLLQPLLEVQARHLQKNLGYVPVEIMIGLIHSDALNVQSEMQRYQLCKSYLNKRKLLGLNYPSPSDISKLFDGLHLDLLSPQDLKLLEKEAIVPKHRISSVYFSQDRLYCGLPPNELSTAPVSRVSFLLQHLCGKEGDSTRAYFSSSGNLELAPEEFETVYEYTFAECKEHLYVGLQYQNRIPYLMFATTNSWMHSRQSQIALGYYMERKIFLLHLAGHQQPVEFTLKDLESYNPLADWDWNIHERTESPHFNRRSDVLKYQSFVKIPFEKVRSHVGHKMMVVLKSSLLFDFGLEPVICKKLASKRSRSQ